MLLLQPPLPHKLINERHTMTRRDKRPSQFRCLSGLLLGLMAAVLAGVLGKLNEALCSLVRTGSQACAVIPADLFYLLYGFAAVGCVFTLYRAYRDFYVGEYYMDLMRRDNRW